MIQTAKTASPHVQGSPVGTEKSNCEKLKGNKLELLRKYV